jgi:hypothetical protein
MTSHETAIAVLLRAAAQRIPVDTTGLEAVGAGPTRVAPAPTRRSGPRRKVLIGGVAAAALASAAAIAVVAGPRSGSDTVTVTPAAGCPMAPHDPAACSSSPVPHLAPPPDWFGTPRSAVRDGAQRTGQWVSMAIGQRPDDETITAPIRISVFEGTYAHLDDAEPVTVDGVQLRSTLIGDWRVLATMGTPTVVAEGEVGTDTLAAVLDAVETADSIAADPASGLSLRAERLPQGYVEIVAPRTLGPDAEYHRTLAGEHGDVGITEISDMTDPLLAATGAGVDLHAVDLGDGTIGWSGVAATASADAGGPVRFLIWAPRPGVVFEIDTYDTVRPDDDLAALARATTAIDPASWDATYDD